jgi:hypothetical protein
MDRCQKTDPAINAEARFSSSGIELRQTLRLDAATLSLLAHGAPDCKALVQRSIAWLLSEQDAR